MSNLQFSLSGQQQEKIHANLLYVTTSKFENDWHSTPHTHYFAELFYVTRGGGLFLVDDESFPVKEDDLVVVNANVDHTEMGIPGMPLEYIVLGVEGLSFEFGPDAQDGSHYIYNCRPYRRNLLFIMETLLHELENRETDYELVCRHLFEVLLIHITRQTASMLSIAAPRRISKECAIAKRYIDAHYKQRITLDQLAATTHINKYYLVHSFQKYLGLSPINYLASKRLEESKLLLRDTNHSIAQIAGLLGFSSQSYFSQVFQKSMGETPGSFRKRIRTIQPRD